MFKNYLSEHNISIYRLAKLSGVPYSTLNDLVNQKLPVENLRSGQLRALADALSMDMHTLYDICQVDKTIRSSNYGVKATISIEHKTYYLNFVRNNRDYKSVLLPVKQEATTYLDILAEWKLDELLSQIEMEDAYEALYTKKV